MTIELNRKAATQEQIDALGQELSAGRLVPGSEAAAQVSAQQAALQQVAARPADFSGATLTARVQALMDSDAPNVFFPPDVTYDLDPVLLRPRKTIFGTKETVVRAKANGQKVFYTLPDAGNSPAQTQRIAVENLTLDAGAFTGVTLLDLPEARGDIHVRDLRFRSSATSHTDATANGCIGLRLPKLNWDCRVSNLDSRGLGTAYRIEKNAACLQLLNLSASYCGIAFDLDGTDQTVDRVTEIWISGPTINQFNGIAVRTRSTTRTVIDGMHFENNICDIDADGDDNLVIKYIAMRGANEGAVSGPTMGIKLRNTIGTRVEYPAMVGARQLGFFDVDATNTDARLYAQVRSTAPLLNNGFLDYPGVTIGLRCMPDDILVTTSGNSDAYRFATTFTRNIGNSQTVTITPQNFRDGQVHHVVLVMASGYSTGTPSTISIGGNAIDMTGAAASKVNTVTLVRTVGLAAGNAFRIVNVSGWQ